MKMFYKTWLGIGFGSILLGMIAIIFALSIGGRSLGMYDKEEYQYSLEDTQENVTSIDLKVDYGEVTIVEGDSFHLQMDYIKQDSFESYKNGDTWIIKNKRENNTFRLFNFDIPINNRMTPKIRITVPKGFSAEQLLFKLGAGSLVADILNTKDSTIDVGAGKMEINQFFASGKSSYSVGAGELVIREITAQNAFLSCGAGRIEMTGSIFGKNVTSCGVGEIQLHLNGKQTDYNYNIDCGLGSVIIQNKSYGGIAVHKTISNQAENQFDLSCGIGKISLTFQGLLD